MKLRNARYLARDIIDELICPGDVVVDATAGNGDSFISAPPSVR